MADPNEIFDVVDENNNVIGKAKRKEVHEKGLWHRVAAVFIFNDKGELLMQRRNKKADVSAGKWSTSSAGHLGTDRDYNEAARRELKEELGIAPRIEEIGSVKIDYPKDKTHARLFKANYEGPFELDKDEVSEVKFMPVKEIEKDISESPERYSKNFLKLFEFYRKRTSGDS